MAPTACLQHTRFGTLSVSSVHSSKGRPVVTRVEPGSADFMAGVVPPPGTCVTNYLYHYSWDAGAELEFPMVGSVELGAEADLLVDTVSLIQIADKEIFGAKAGGSDL